MAIELTREGFNTKLPLFVTNDYLKGPLSFYSSVATSQSTLWSERESAESWLHLINFMRIVYKKKPSQGWPVIARAVLPCSCCVQIIEQLRVSLVSFEIFAVISSKVEYPSMQRKCIKPNIIQVMLISNKIQVINKLDNVAVSHCIYSH